MAKGNLTRCLGEVWPFEGGSCRQFLRRVKVV